MREIDMKEMFDEADQERRDSQDLVAIPRKVVRFMFITIYFFPIQVYTKFNRNTVAKVSGTAKFAKKQNGFINIDLEKLKSQIVQLINLHLNSFNLNVAIQI